MTTNRKMSLGRAKACEIVAELTSYRDQCDRESLTSTGSVKEYWNGKAAGITTAIDMLSTGKAASALRVLCRAADKMEKRK